MSSGELAGDGLTILELIEAPNDEHRYKFARHDGPGPGPLHRSRDIAAGDRGAVDDCHFPSTRQFIEPRCR